jgi:hypothetical protein
VVGAWFAASRTRDGRLRGIALSSRDHLVIISPARTIRRGTRRRGVAGVRIVIVGALFLEQRQSVKKFIGIAIVIAGVVGLQLSGAA